MKPPILRCATFEELCDNWQGNFNLMPMAERQKWCSFLYDRLESGEDSAVVMALLGKLDLFFMAKVILGYRQVAIEPHRECADFIVNPDIPRKILMMPRGWFKTTVGTKSDCVRLSINDPDIRILLCNATAENAESFLSEIEDHFQSNQLLRSLYGYCIPKNFRKVKWNQKEMELLHDTVHSESTIEAIGVGGTATSRHFDVLKRDDLVEFKHAQSRVEMDRVIEWGRYIVGLFTPPIEGRSYRWDHVVGTRWSYYDFLSNLIDNHKEYIVHKVEDTVPGSQPVIYVDTLSGKIGIGPSTFPTVYPPEAIAQIIRDCESLKVYYCMYKNNPIPGETQKIKPEYIQWVDEIPQNLRIVTLVDPAVGETEDSCQQAVITVGFEPPTFRRWYVLDVSFGVVPVSTSDNSASLINFMFDHYFKWRDAGDYDSMYAEAFAFQKTLKHIVRLECQNRNIYVNPLRELPIATDRSKDARISGLEGPFSFGNVFLYRKGRNMDELVKQLVGYPSYKYKDCVDALAWAMFLNRTIATEVPSTPKPAYFVPGGVSFDACLDAIKSRTDDSMPLFDKQAIYDKYVGSN